MKLTGPQLGQVQAAILSAFDDSALQQCLQFQLDKNLDHIAKRENFPARVFELLNAANNGGWMVGLLRALKSCNPRPDLHKALDAILEDPKPGREKMETVNRNEGDNMDEKTGNGQSGGVNTIPSGVSTQNAAIPPRILERPIAISAVKLSVRIKLGEAVFHDKPYPHPRDGHDCPPDFYGRQQEKQDILTHLHNLDARQPIIVQGERRMGKTSMLRLAEEELKGHDQLLAVRLADGVHIHSLEQLWVNMAELILADAEGAGKHLPRVPAYPGPIAAIRVLHGHTKRWAPGKTAVFLWDEMDECLANVSLPYSERYSILYFLSYLHWTGFSKLLFSMIRTPEAIALNDVRHFIDTSKLLCLKPFEDGSDFAAMLQAPWEPEQPFTPDQISAIHRESGGWPYFAKVILDWFAKTADTERDLDLLQTAILRASNYAPDSLLTRTMRLIDEHHFDPDEKFVLNTLACRSGGVTRDELGRLSSELPRAAVRLRDRHYLQYDSTSYSFRIGMLRQWYKSSGLCDDWPGYIR